MPRKQSKLWMAHYAAAHVAAPTRTWLPSTPLPVLRWLTWTSGLLPPEEHL